MARVILLKLSAAEVNLPVEKAPEYMDNLGIKYTYAVEQPSLGVVHFWNPVAEDLEDLPQCMQLKDLDPIGFVGFGLDEATAVEIANVETTITAMWEHIKSGVSYLVHKMDAKDATNATEGRKMVVYSNIDGDKFFTREYDEFNEKFKKVVNYG